MVSTLFVLYQNQFLCIVQSNTKQFSHLSYFVEFWANTSFVPSETYNFSFSINITIHIKIKLKRIFIRLSWENFKMSNNFTRISAQKVVGNANITKEYANKFLLRNEQSTMKEKLKITHCILSQSNSHDQFRNFNQKTSLQIY